LNSHFDLIAPQYEPLETEVKEDFLIMDLMKKTSNNLGATYQKKYDTTRKSKYLISATKYYYISTKYFDKISADKASDTDAYKEKNTQLGTETSRYKKELSHINVRMSLYPDAGTDEPLLYEDFPLEYTTYM
jgi:hypothetical protein